jgi:hypothetical protein
MRCWGTGSAAATNRHSHASQQGGDTGEGTTTILSQWTMANCPGATGHSYSMINQCGVAAHAIRPVGQPQTPPGGSYYSRRSKVPHPQWCPKVCRVPVATSCIEVPSLCFGSALLNPHAPRGRTVRQVSMCRRVPRESAQWHDVHCTAVATCGHVSTIARGSQPPDAAWHPRASRSQ